MAHGDIITHGNKRAISGDSFNLSNYAGTNYPGALGSTDLIPATRLSARPPAILRL